MTLPVRSEPLGPGTEKPPPAVEPEENPRRGRGAWLAVCGGLLIMVLLFLAGLVFIPRFQAAHPPSELQRSDADRAGFDDLYLDLTLVTPSFLESRKLERYLGERDPQTVLPVLVGLNTHTGTIEHMHHLPNTLSLVGPSGQRYPSLSEPIVLSQHHNAYLVLFPARDQVGELFLRQSEGVLSIEATNLGLTPVRRFEWQLPLPETSGTGSTSWAVRVALFLALVSALLVVLSPCALELSLYYSAIIACTVTAADASEPSARGSFSIGTGGRARWRERQVLANLTAFVVGFTLLYAVSGATVGLIGEGVRRPFGEYGEIFQVFGGSLILYFALRVSGLLDRFPALLRRRGEPTGPRPGGLLKRWRLESQQRARNGEGLRARDSFLVGMGLSSACLTCMGGAVLYPLLVYAGITSWYTGLITLTLYSLGIAVPMMMIALGFARIQPTLARRMAFTRALRAVSAALLFLVGGLILTGNERVVTDLAFRFLAGTSKWLA